MVSNGDAPYGGNVKFRSEMMKLDDWLIVNPDVHLQLARKFDVSRITIYFI